MRKLGAILILITTLAACRTETKQQPQQAPAAEECVACPVWKNRQDTLAFLTDVRRFVAQKTSAGKIKNPLCDTFASIPISEFPTDKYLQILEQNEGTATCGLAATIMVKILLDNGIRAYLYDFGFKEHFLTHVLVLVEHGGKLLIFDPFLNYEVLDETGKNLGLIELFEGIKTDALRLQHSTDSVLADVRVDLRLLRKEHVQFLSKPECTETMLHTSINDSILSFKSYRCFECAANAPCDSFVQKFVSKLKAESKLKQFHEGMLFKLHPLTGASDSHLVNARVDSIIAELRPVKAPTLP